MLAYLNGELLPETEAKVSIFDRGFLFGDAVYEVVPIIDGQLVNRQAHGERLARSLTELALPAPLDSTALAAAQDELVRRNEVREGRLYLQISRGPAERDFAFPSEPQPTLIMVTRHAALIDSEAARRGIKVCTLPDQRWARRDIKTVMLLASSLAKQTARERGFDDAWLVENGRITEGTSNNAYIVSNGVIRTRPLSNDILAGCTRRALLRLAGEHQLRVVEETFTPADAYRAEEAFITSASTFVTPVVQIDQQVLGGGEPGPISRRLREIYIADARAQARAAAGREV